MGRILLQRGQGDGRDRRRALPRRVLSHHAKQPAGRQHRGAGHPRPLRLRQALVLGWQRPRGDGHLHAQQPGRQLRQRRDDPNRVHGVAHRGRRASLGKPRVADRVTALHRLVRRAVPIDPRQPDRGQVHGRVVDLHQRQVRPRTVRHPRQSEGPRWPSSSLLCGSRTWTLTAPATTWAAVSTVRPRHDAPRPIPVRARRPPPPGRRSPPPTGPPTAPTPPRATP